MQCVVKFPAVVCILDIFFVKSQHSFYKNLSIKGTEAQNQRQHKYLGALRFDEKVYLMYVTKFGKKLVMNHLIK